MPARMSWYAETPALRSRQVLADASVAVWVLVWLWIGTYVHDVVGRLAEGGRDLEAAGSRISGGLSGAAEGADDVPLVGDDLREPLDLAAGAGRSLADAGQAQQDAVQVLALLLALLLAGVPVVLVLARWLPSRLSFAREHRAAQALRDDVELWALRAALHRPLPELARLGPDAVERWRRGEPGAAQALAALELLARGLRG